MVSTSCSTNGTRRATLVTNPVISHGTLQIVPFLWRKNILQLYLLCSINSLLVKEIYNTFWSVFISYFDSYRSQNQIYIYIYIYIQLNLVVKIVLSRFKLSAFQLNLLLIMTDIFISVQLCYIYRFLGKFVLLIIL